MADISKITNVAIENVAKVCGVAVANIAKVINNIYVSFANTHSYLFDGTDDYINATSAISAFDKDEGTFHLRVKLAAAGAPSKFMLAIADGNNANFIRIFYHGSQTKLFFQCKTAGTNKNATSSAGALGADGNWHTICCTWSRSAGEFKAYFDATQVSTTKTIGSSTWSPTVFNIGANQNTSSNAPWRGGIDEPAMWSSALSAAEITALETPIDLLSDSGNYSSSSNLTMWYRADGDTGTNCDDHTSEDNDATRVNGTSLSTDAPSI